MKTRFLPCLVLLLVLVYGLVAAPARAQDPDDPYTSSGRWHFAVSPYLWATGMEGTISFQGTPEVPVDASFSDILENLDLALSLHFEGRRDRWGFALDGMYFKIGATATFDIPVGPPGSSPQGKIAVDLQEAVVEGFVFYRLAVGERSVNPGFADAFVGMRYISANQEITTARLDLPRRELGWADAVFGLRGYLPLGDRFGLMARGDIGAGSSFTWSLKGDLHWRVSDRWRVIAGYRYMDVDYEKGEGLVDREVYQMTHSGAEVAVAFGW